jgi:hypothetical protein
MSVIWSIRKMTYTDKLIFPYGERELPESFLVRQEVRNYREDYDFPDTFPVKHPVLVALQDTSFLPSPILPDWFDTMLGTLPSPLRWFVMDVDAEHFATGKAASEQWKLFRNMLTEEQKKAYGQSPSLSKMISFSSNASYYLSKFTERGHKTINKIHFTCLPEELFYMANGSGWESCQHYAEGSYRENLRATMWETGNAMAYMLDDESKPISHEDNVLARCLVRVMYLVGDDERIPILVLDRGYGTDTMTIRHFKHAVQEYLVGQGYSTSWVYDNPQSFPTNKVNGYSCSRPRQWGGGYQDSFQYVTANVIDHDSVSYYIGNLTGSIYTPTHMKES